MMLSVAVRQWLLDSDPSIRWQVMQDLTAAPAHEVAVERAKIATEGWGARLLTLQGENGRWDNTAEVIAQDRKGETVWTRFAFPTWWHYDVLRGLDYLRRANVTPDARLAEAIALVESKRDGNGRFPLEPRRVFPQNWGDFVRQWLRTGRVSGRRPGGSTRLADAGRVAGCHRHRPIYARASADYRYLRRISHRGRAGGNCGHAGHLFAFVFVCAAAQSADSQNAAVALALSLFGCSERGSGGANGRGAAQPGSANVAQLAKHLDCFASAGGLNSLQGQLRLDCAGRRDIRLRTIASRLKENHRFRRLHRF